MITFPIVTRVLGSTTLNTGGTTSVNTTAAKSYNSDFVMFSIRLGTIAAGGGLSSIVAQGSNDGSNWTAITISPSIVVGDTDDNNFVCVLLGVNQGKFRDYRLVLTTAGAVNSVIDYVDAYAFSNRVAPVPLSASGFLYRATN